MAHTPGPWKWWTSSSWRRLTSHEGGRSRQDGGVLCPVTQCSDGHPDVLVSEDDMGLIAASPDLLDAAQMGRDALQAMVGLFKPDPAGMALAALNKLDAAIRKAQTPVSR